MCSRWYKCIEIGGGERLLRGSAALRWERGLKKSKVRKKYDRWSCILPSKNASYLAIIFLKNYS